MSHSCVAETLQRKSHSFIPFLGISRPQSQFPHSCVYEQFIYSQDWSTYFLQQIDCCRENPFLGIFVSNFRYWFFAGKDTGIEPEPVQTMTMKTKYIFKIILRKQIGDCGGSAYVCKVVHKYIYRNTYYYIMAPVEF
jgi:hypothetical protein